MLPCSHACESAIATVPLRWKGAPVSAPKIQDVLALIAAGTVFIGTFLPWATVDSLVITVSQNGIDAEDGIISLIAALVAVAAVAGALYGRPRFGGVIVVLCGVVSAAVGIVDWGTVLDNPPARVGIGLVLVAIGGVALTLLGGIIVAAGRTPSAPVSASPAVSTMLERMETRRMEHQALEQEREATEGARAEDAPQERQEWWPSVPKPEPTLAAQVAALEERVAALEARRRERDALVC